MALIKCPECGKEISDKAESCPNCGYPIPQFIELELKISTKSYKARKNSWFFYISVNQYEHPDISQYAKNFKTGLFVELKSKENASLGAFKTDKLYFIDSWSKTISIFFNGLDDNIAESAEYAVFKLPKPESTFRCPKCGSTNVARIGGGRKAASALAFGLFSINTLTSQYQCHDCGYKF